MPMFDLEKADKVDLVECSTTSETLLKAKKIGVLKAEGCKAGAATVAPVSKWEKLKSFCVAQTTLIVSTVIAGLIVAALGLIYGPMVISRFS